MTLVLDVSSRYLKHPNSTGPASKLQSMAKLADIKDVNLSCIFRYRLLGHLPQILPCRRWYRLHGILPSWSWLWSILSSGAHELCPDLVWIWTAQYDELVAFDYLPQCQAAHSQPISAEHQQGGDSIPEGQYWLLRERKRYLPTS